MSTFYDIVYWPLTDPWLRIRRCFGSVLILCLAVGLGATDVYAQQQQERQKGQLRTAPEPALSYDLPDGPEAKATSLFNEDFERDVSEWTLEGSWEIGAPTSGPDTAYRSVNAAGTVLDGDHPNEADDRLVSPAFSLPTLSEGEEIVLSFFEWYALESGFDQGSVQISTDGGTEWTTLESRDGATGTWRPEQVVLSDYAGEEVQLGFHLSSDEDSTNAGWYIDNLLVFTTEQPPLDLNITSRNPGSFPFIFSNVTVNSYGEPEPGLKQSNFAAYEDGVLQDNRFSVTPPDEGSELRLTDIVFVIDRTGSMGDEIAAVRDNVISFVDALEEESVNFNLGLITYGDTVEVKLEGTLTPDADKYRDLVSEVPATGGGFIPENGVGALQTAISEYSFRPGSQKIFILITDATSWLPEDEPFSDDPVKPTPISLSELTGRLQDASITTYAAAIDDPIYKGVGSITEATGGMYFDVTDPFDEILDDISTTVSNNYIVRYHTKNDVRDGVERTLRIEASDASGSDSDTTHYTPGASPEISRTSDTRDLALEGQSESEDVTITAEITDRADPDVESATLFYKNAEATSYSSVKMSATDEEDIYEATISASELSPPGMDYFLTATDGVSTTSSPSTNPRAEAWQFGVENDPPTVEHEPVKAFTPDRDVSISASVSDDEAVEEVRVFFRAFGELAFRSREMTPSADGSSKAEEGIFEGEIPGSAITVSGVEYYIEAVDNHGIGNSAGDLDEPNRSLFPAPPTELNSELEAGEVVLDWPAPSETGLEEYRVYRSTAPIDTTEGTPSDLSVLASVDASSTTYTDAAEPGYTYYYRVTSVDTTGEESAVSSQQQVFLYPETVSANVNRSFGRASSADDYRLVSLPGAVSRSLSDGIDGEADADWQAFWDDGSDYVKYDGSSTFSFEEGRGFWLTSTQDWTAEEDIGAVTLQGDTVTTIDLHDGWNIISNPLDKDVEWDFVEEINDASLQSLWSFDGGFSETTTFHSAASGEAFYFLNDQGLDELIVPYPDAPFKRSSTTKSTDAPEQVLRLVAERATGAGTVKASSDIRVGFSKRATEDRDALDAVAPPSNFSTLSLHIDDRAQVDDPRQQFLSADIRPPTEEGQTYELRLTAKGTSPVQLSAQGLEEFGREVVLLQPGDGSSYDLTTDEAVTLRPTQESTRLQLAVGSKAYVEDQKDDLLPDKVTLTSYPNPFHQQATVEYTLPEAADVRLVVYDVLGREVAELANGRQEAGRHRVQLQGSSLSSGVYFGRLEVGSERHTKKITVVR